MNEHVRQSVQIEEHRQHLERTAEMIDRAARRLNIRKDEGESREEFRSRVPAIVRAMAKFHLVAAEIAPTLPE